ncbi:transcriptional repressor p66-beta isoform X2 [Anthonomus grandis grandis]|uniref:transcriptional repressor p66-beta isoform X2 n=1 Tax=Anthonomus grandis grandis TaxID=2921223 RepID=UPI002166BB11|nr:transcriptional repressor p66-beta isoform X2 [Anthonomus grandis grandis]
MEVDEAVVDLSIGVPHPLRPNASNNYDTGQIIQQSISTMVNSRRILRPRTEPRRYVESPDALINGSLGRLNGRNGVEFDSDSSEGEMPPLPPPIKELSPDELKQRDRGLRRLREELRAEEMKLVLLKKLKQSQQLKENVAVQLPPGVPPSALPPAGLPSGLSITPTIVKLPSSNGKNVTPQAAHTRHPLTPNSVPKNVPSGVPSLLRGQSNSGSRSGIHAPQITATPLTTTNRAANVSVSQAPRGSGGIQRPPGFPPGVKDLSPSVTITPAPPQPLKNLPGHDNKPLGMSQHSGISEERPREDNQTPAQRQAAAKLALRKQLEKTLLQIPPPKPPPPEMHFIPNPSNTEFIYLVGLEHVVDFLTKETKMPLPPQPFSCTQCNQDFTPVWKWEGKNKKASRVICEQCVTNNVKKALKAEHTNRLKTAFVKALQQEQEIEQRLAQNGSFSTTSPAQSPSAPEPAVTTPKSVTPTPAPRHAATPTPPAPPPQPTPPPPPSRSSHQSSSSQHQSSSSAQQQDKYSAQQSAAAMQAFHQQLLRTITQGGPPAAAHLMHLPLFYPYQLAMAQAQAAAASAGKSSGNAGVAPNIAEQMQRAADLQRQYLLDMIPPAPGQRHNWKT